MRGRICSNHWKHILSRFRSYIFVASPFLLWDPLSLPVPEILFRGLPRAPLPHPCHSGFKHHLYRDNLPPFSADPYAHTPPPGRLSRPEPVRATLVLGSSTPTFQRAPSQCCPLPSSTARKLKISGTVGWIKDIEWHRRETWILFSYQRLRELPLCPTSRNLLHSTWNSCKVEAKEGNSLEPVNVKSRALPLSHRRTV